MQVVGQTSQNRYLTPHTHTHTHTHTTHTPTDSKAVGGGSDETERGKQACLNTGKDNVLKHAHSKKQQTLASPAPASANSAGFRSSMQRPLGGTTNIRKRNIQPSPSTGTHTTTNTLTRPPKTSRSAEETITHSDVDSEADTTAETVTEESSGRRRSGKRRYIAFVGNLPFSATTEEVVQHFAKRGVRVTEARLLTRRESDQSRGCCFTEFPNSKTLQVYYVHCVLLSSAFNCREQCVSYQIQKK